MSENTKNTPVKGWARHQISSWSVCAGGILAGTFWQPRAVGLLILLVVLGTVAGWFSRRTGWLCGIIVGLPVALFSVTRLALRDTGSLPLLLSQRDYWVLAFPAAFTSAGMAILGGVIGAWLHDMKLQRDA